jgi:hypothetical protein
VGFFLRVRPDAATVITAGGASFEGIEITDPDLGGYQGRYGIGSVIRASEKDAERLEAVGFERIDDSFSAVRIREETHPGMVLGVDLSNDRVVGIVEDAPPSTLASGPTEADRMRHQLAALLKSSGLDEETFRQQLLADPRVAMYADAEFPELRFYVSRGEAIGLVAADMAEPIYVDPDKFAAELFRLLGG